jgi:hypothetical protein
MLVSVVKSSFSDTLLARLGYLPRRSSMMITKIVRWIRDSSLVRLIQIDLVFFPFLASPFFSFSFSLSFSFFLHLLIFQRHPLLEYSTYSTPQELNLQIHISCGILQLVLPRRWLVLAQR